MVEHQHSHTDTYTIRCAPCGKGFTREKYLKQHRCGLLARRGEEHQARKRRPGARRGPCKSKRGPAESRTAPGSEEGVEERQPAQNGQCREEHVIVLSESEEANATNNTDQNWLTISSPGTSSLTELPSSQG
eukprot:g33624.t1